MTKFMQFHDDAQFFFLLLVAAVSMGGGGEFPHYFLDIFRLQQNFFSEMFHFSLAW